MANQKKSTAPKKRKNTNSVRVEINRIKKQEKHQRKHPNDKGVVREKVQEYETCSICGKPELPKYMDHKLIGDVEVKRCRSCRHVNVEHFHNVIKFPKGLRNSLPKG